MNKKFHTTVTLIKKDNDTEHLWYCPDCRNPVIKYKGEVVSIIPGYAPSELPLIRQCRNDDCGRNYVFCYFAEEELNA